MRLFQGFKAFILRGNLVDLAVAFVIGAAFSSVVQALVKDLITPLLGIFGGFSFPAWSFRVNGSVFQLGEFLNSLISFVLIAMVVFLFVVRPVALLLEQMKKHEKQLDPDTRPCPFCRNEISIQATRCGFCTSDVAVALATLVGTETERQEAQGQ
jgi:large conductance mechanosensitive channel